MGKNEEAERTLDLLLSSIGEYVPALLVKGEILLAQGKSGSALDTFEQALKKDPSETFAMSGMGQAWLQMGQLEEAEKMIRQVLKLNGENAQDWSNLGTVLYQNNDLDEAIDCFSRAIQIAGEPEFHIQRAACLYAQKNVKEALLDLRHVGKDRNRFSMLFFFLFLVSF
jgi:tetratricopeptide (TPR) repeat protein